MVIKAKNLRVYARGIGHGKGDRKERNTEREEEQTLFVV